MELSSFSHSCGESNFHIVFCVKYRHAIFENKIIKGVCEKLFREVEVRHRIGIRVMKIMGEHVHLFLRFKPYQCPSFAVHKFKGYSAKRLFEIFPWLTEKDPKDKKRFWGRHFWSGGYFFRSVGSTTDKAVEFYIRLSQDKVMRDKYYTYVGKRTKSAETSEDPYIEFLREQKSLNEFVD